MNVFGFLGAIFHSGHRLYFCMSIAVQLIFRWHSKSGCLKALFTLQFIVVDFGVTPSPLHCNGSCFQASMHRAAAFKMLNMPHQVHYMPDLMFSIHTCEFDTSLWEVFTHISQQMVTRLANCCVLSSPSILMVDFAVEKLDFMTVK